MEQRFLASSTAWQLFPNPSDEDNDAHIDPHLKIMRKKRSFGSPSPYLTVGDDSRRQSTVLFDTVQTQLERPEPPENYFIKVHLKTTFGYRKKLCLMSNGMLYLYTSHDK
uniref:Uncharacterized protein n=1 Tax=Romanomermis culicivorax TaxID=13658 RepID=A0A915JCZ4_ROMCU